MEHIKRANLQVQYWRHCLEHNMKKLDPSRDGWCKDETNGLRRFWYECSQLPTPMKEKRKSQAKRKEVDLVEQSKAIDERPQGLSAMVAKIQMDDISPDEELLEGSDDNNDIYFASEGESSGSDSSENSDRFLLKINRLSGFCIFDEYIKT